ncbi:hypothetical protein LXA47_05265 [Massilia sp. P8910]|uniref:hypothetical protein n=1 Tax=Massilia antarctica TaxID=2765360 RepID=UPI001E53EFE8|nr:hypothetical protein [Massilia antarctica]MCE3603012.1 hypothetical protein [Massilia antarctica]
MEDEIYSADERYTLERIANASTVERLELMKLPASKAVAKKTRDWMKTKPEFGQAIGAALYELSPDNQKNNEQAIQFLVYGISRILERPEIRKSEEICLVIQEVHEALAALTIFDSAADVATAFALPGRRKTNKRNAGKFRSEEESIAAAYSCFQRWSRDPEIYKTMAAFCRDMIVKEFCLDPETPKRWISGWARKLPLDHVLRRKLGKLNKK